MKVSFDFDSTLSRVVVQDYATNLITQGFDVWIVTSRSKSLVSRYTIEGMRVEGMNDDLYKVANRLGIPKSRIVFTEFADKSEFFLGKDFLFHLDDDWFEVELINRNTSVREISCMGNKKWMKECDGLIEKL